MPRKKLNKPVTYLQVQIDPIDKEALDRWCEANQTTMSKVIREAIAPYIKKGKTI